MFARSNFYCRLQLPLIINHITCISLSLCRTSAPIHLTSVLGVLGTQETSCILIVGLLERDTFDLFLPEFDNPWVIHLRETCCCSTNLCTWRPNTVYKNRSIHRHHTSIQTIESMSIVTEKFYKFLYCFVVFKIVHVDLSASISKKNFNFYIFKYIIFHFVHKNAYQSQYDPLFEETNEVDIKIFLVPVILFRYTFCGFSRDNIRDILKLSSCFTSI
jgi:hypothetical protein